MNRIGLAGWLLAALMVAFLAPRALNAGNTSDGTLDGRARDDAGTHVLQGNLSHAFTYQGFLSTGGVPVEGTREMEFSLVSAPRMGKVIAGPLKQTVKVSAGLFSTTLGFAGQPFDGRALWLSMRLQDRDNTWANLGAQPILTVPYAASLMPGAKVIESSPDNPALVLKNTDGRALAVEGSFRGIDAFVTGTEENQAAVSGQAVATSGNARGGAFASVSGTGVYAVSLSDNGVEGKGCTTETDCYGGYFEGNGGIHAKSMGSRPGPAGRFDGDVAIQGTLHGRNATFYDITASGDLVVEGTARLNRDVFITGENSKLAVSGPMFTSFPRPVFDSGWVDVSKDSTMTMNHNVGGDADDYFVDFLCKPAAGISNNAIGGYKSGFVPQPLTAHGSYFDRLTRTSVRVVRRKHDGTCPEMRLRIWVIK